MSIQNLLNSTPIKLVNTSESTLLNNENKGSEALVTDEANQKNAFMQLLDSLLGNNEDGDVVDPVLNQVDDQGGNEILAEQLIQSNVSSKEGNPLSIGINKTEVSKTPKDISSEKVLGKFFSASKVGEGALPNNGEKVQTESVLDTLKIGSSQAKDSLTKSLNVEQKTQNAAMKELLGGPELVPAEQQSAKQLMQKQLLLKKLNGKNSYKSSNLANDSLIKINHLNEKSVQPMLQNALVNPSKDDGLDRTKTLRSEHSESSIVDNKSNLSQFLGVTKVSAPVTASVANQNVVHMSNFDNISAQELINKISTYIEQNNFAKNENLNITVHHKQLGQFDVAVQNNQHTQRLDILINSATQEGNNFFQNHEKQLVMKLHQAGIELSDFKVVSRVAQLDAARNSGESSFNNSDSQNGRSSSQSQHGSAQQNADSNKRKNLWEEYRERYYA